MKSREKALIVNYYLYTIIAVVFVVLTWLTHNDFMATMGMSFTLMSCVTLLVANWFGSKEGKINALMMIIGFVLIIPGSILAVTCHAVNKTFNLYTDEDLEEDEDRVYYEDYDE